MKGHSEIPRVRPSVSLGGNGGRLVGGVSLSPQRELRAFVVFHNGHPRSIGIRLHWNAHSGRVPPSNPEVFTPVEIPMDCVAAVQALLSQAHDLALESGYDPNPYAEEGVR